MRSRVIEVATIFPLRCSQVSHRVELPQNLIKSTGVMRGCIMKNTNKQWAIKLNSTPQRKKDEISSKANGERANPHQRLPCSKGMEQVISNKLNM